ncbi:conserved hypothetical protein [Latilactobacillus sakei]|nr:conserved hypothetical protein [Latilactobacillus sakei]
MMYFLLSRALADANREVAPEVYQKITGMPIYGVIMKPYFWVIQVALIVAIYFFPAIELIFVILEVFVIGNRTGSDSDKLFHD